MKKIVRYIGPDVHKETIAGVVAPGKVIANEPIYSLRSPGFAGK